MESHPYQSNLDRKRFRYSGVDTTIKLADDHIWINMSGIIIIVSVPASVVKCDYLVGVDGGSLLYLDYIINRQDGKVRYQCNGGYSRSTKHSEISCLSSEKWSGVIPTCKLSPGPALPKTFSRLFTTEINSAIANYLKSTGMMKIQCMTIYPNIYKCVTDYMTNLSRLFLNTDILRMKQDSFGLIRQNENNFREIRK